MKVFHILSNPSIGGIEVMLSNLLPMFSEYDFRVINMRSESSAYNLWDRKGVKYFCLGTPKWNLISSIIRLFILLKKENPDIVEIYGLRANFIARIAARLAGVPVIITGVLNTDDWRRWYHIWVDRLTSFFVTAWIPNSKACTESLIKREHFSKKKIHTIYDGIDVEYWSPNGKDRIRKQIRESFGLNQEHIIFTTIANFRYQKGYPYLIRAIKDIVLFHPNARFLFVGGGAMEEELKLLCSKLRIDEYIRFIGYRKDIKDIYMASDIALLPSLFEGLPISLIEAMAMKLPVISTRVSGIPELVVEGETGLLIESANSEQIVTAARTLLQNSDLRNTFGEAGRRRVVKKFSLTRMRDELLMFYNNKLLQVKVK